MRTYGLVARSLGQFPKGAGSNPTIPSQIFILFQKQWSYRVFLQDFIFYIFFNAGKSVKLLIFNTSFELSYWHITTLKYYFIQKNSYLIHKFTDPSKEKSETRNSQEPQSKETSQPNSLTSSSISTDSKTEKTDNADKADNADKTGNVEIADKVERTESDAWPLMYRMCRR